MELTNTRAQEDPSWCIPAVIENVLRHYGEMGWDQRRIIGAWAKWKNGTPSFDLGSPAQFLPTTELGGRFTFNFQPFSLQKAKHVLAERSVRQLPTIVSCAIPGLPGCAHMRIVMAFSDELITAFDPNDASHQRWTWSEFGPLLGAGDRDVHMLLIDPIPTSVHGPCDESTS